MTAPPEATVKLPQGTCYGSTMDSVNRYLGVPYAEPIIRRFQSPVKISSSANPMQAANALGWGPLSPQKPSRLEIVCGKAPAAPHSGVQDELNCNVLSVYQPKHAANDPDASLPVIVFIHGGAYLTGGSQISWYDGSRLARDGNCVVVCINYRLGAFGFMYQEGQKASPAFEDAICALEWVRDNISAFRGDPDEVTVMGQSAGAYTVQLLLDTRPDLFRRAIVQSSPANIAMNPNLANAIAKSIQGGLPAGVDVHSATTEQMLDASMHGVKANAPMIIAYAPLILDGRPPGGRVPVEPRHKKDVLVGWTRDDGSCFAALQRGRTSISYAEPLSQSLTEDLFRIGSLDLADRLRRVGHNVTVFTHEWRPEGSELGATHCIDLPLVFGDEEAWKTAPVLGKAPWAEWERRGRLIRKAWGDFARDGAVPEQLEGVKIEKTQST